MVVIPSPNPEQGATAWQISCLCYCFLKCRPPPCASGEHAGIRTCLLNEEQLGAACLSVALYAERRLDETGVHPTHQGPDPFLAHMHMRFRLEPVPGTSFLTIVSAGSMAPSVKRDVAPAIQCWCSKASGAGRDSGCRQSVSCDGGFRSLLMPAWSVVTRIACRGPTHRKPSLQC